MLEKNLKCRCAIEHHNHSSPGSLPRSSKFFISESRPHYAPDKLVEIEHIKLEISVDLKSKTLSGVCTQTVKGVAPVTGVLNFDAYDLVVSKVTDSSGADLKFNQTESAVTVNLKKAVNRDEKADISLHYKVVEPRAGLYFIQPDEHYPDRPWQLWTQGQDQDNRFWIPCHDSPNAKSTTEMIVTVDSRYSAISNGKLMDVRLDEASKKKTFHWMQSIPHSSYLITLCIGEFVEIKDSWKNSKGETVPVNYYTMPGKEEETRFSFGKTPKMLEFYSKKTGVDYPYEKYAQVVAAEFIYGGMENTSSTTQTEYTLHPESIEQDYSSEPLVSHELAHQWFGDLLTCKEWSHAWLNEGFATYMESLWFEHEYGVDEMLYDLYANEKIYKGEDSGGYRRPIVTNVFMSPSDIFDRHLYEKGGRVLHMLRTMVGDDLWWKAINKYLLDNHSKTVETVDLQRAFEAVTGRALSWFFDQWVFKAGYPEVKATYEWSEEKKLAKFTVAQTQKCDDLTGLFQFPLKFKIATADGEYIHEVQVKQKESVFAFPCSEKPKFVSVNVGNEILGKWEFKPGRDILIQALLQDKDLMGRIAAAKELSKDHSRASVEALGKALENEKFWGAQAEICESLGVIGSELSREYLMKAAEKLRHPKARARCLRALGVFKSSQVVELCEKVLKNDPSPLCAYEAAITMARSNQNGVFEKLNAMLGKRKMWLEYSDRGIIAAMGELKQDERALPVIMKYTKPGHHYFVRREAILALEKNAHARPSLVVDALIEFTRDPNFFVRLYAVDALERLSDSRAMGALQRVADSVVEPRTKRAALVAMKSIREEGGREAYADKLKEELDRLSGQYRELVSRLEKLEKN